MKSEAIEIADIFVRKGIEDDKSVSPAKLNALVYFAYGWTAAIVGEELFREKFETGNLGPTVPSVYEEFKEWENFDVLEPSGKTRANPRKEIADVIDEVWRSMKDMSAARLCNMTHAKGTPWKEAVEKRRSFVDSASIRKYFEKELRERKNSEETLEIEI